MPTGTHFTTPGVQTIAGLMTQMSTSVRIGTQESALNAAITVDGYDAYVGINNTYALNLGEVTAIGFSHVPSFEYADSINVLKSAFRRTTDLEVKASFGVQQLSPQVIAALVNTGELHTINTTERLITGGLAGSNYVRPIEFCAVNEAKDAPSVATDVETALMVMVITMYRGEGASGWSLENLERANFAGFDAEFDGLPVAALPSSRAYWSAYFF